MLLFEEDGGNSDRKIVTGSKCATKRRMPQDFPLEWERADRCLEDATGSPPSDFDQAPIQW